ncbi:hypothetical protein BJ878DRAFT_263839 [Calycina marina]|uniref:Uncharacterized protein n=1 Tax=Calycina marina TaxID=1763456 RepID=A0A9P7YWA5_9HELO|nr:hypothetical protein BJ878DRAFT_263839 [Calycina marina]
MLALTPGLNTCFSTIILNMIGLMGASEWYEKELAKAGIDPPRTKKGRPRKRLATIFLDEYFNKPLESTSIRSPGKLTPNNREDHSLSLNSAGIQKSILTARRKKLTTHFNRGRTLRNLVQITHLGILFDQDIWSYVKSSKEEINKVALLFQADPQKMKLLSTIDEQVELLVKTGQPDLSRFFDSLESHAIITSEEVSSLRAKYEQEREPVPRGELDTTINRIVERISYSLCKEILSDDDAMMVNGTVELSCGIFDRLRSKEWQNGWDITAILEMTDRPIFVRLGHSTQLHEKDAEGKIIPM